MDEGVSGARRRKIQWYIMSNTIYEGHRGQYSAVQINVLYSGYCVHTWRPPLGGSELVKVPVMVIGASLRPAT